MKTLLVLSSITKTLYKIITNKIHNIIAIHCYVAFMVEFQIHGEVHLGIRIKPPFS